MNNCSRLLTIAALLLAGPANLSDRPAGNEASPAALPTAPAPAVYRPVLARGRDALLDPVHF